MVAFYEAEQSRRCIFGVVESSPVGLWSKTSRPRGVLNTLWGALGSVWDTFGCPDGVWHIFGATSYLGTFHNPVLWRGESHRFFLRTSCLGNLLGFFRILSTEEDRCASDSEGFRRSARCTRLGMGQPNSRNTAGSSQRRRIMVTLVLRSVLTHCTYMCLVYSAWII